MVVLQVALGVIGRRDVPIVGNQILAFCLFFLLASVDGHLHIVDAWVVGMLDGCCFFISGGRFLADDSMVVVHIKLYYFRLWIVKHRRVFQG